MVNGVRRSLAASFFGQYLTVFIQFGSSLVLARLLSPAEIGVYSVAVVIFSFAHVFRDFGVTNYLIQEKDLTPEKVRSAAGVSLLLAWPLAFAMFLLSDQVAKFYGEPGIGHVIRVLAITFIFIPFSSPAIACLRRQMQFDKVSMINVLSAAANAVVGISLAFSGAGFMSLAWGALAQALTTLLLARLLDSTATPIWPRFANMRAPIKFGGKATLAGILSQAGRGGSDLIAGKLIGFSAVGLYSKAWGIASLFNQFMTTAITPVMQSNLAQANRRGDGIESGYLRTLTFALPLAFSFYGFAAVMAEPLILLLFGDQWLQSAPVLRVLCLAFAFQSLTVFSGHAMLSMGAVDKHLMLQVITQPARLVAIFFAAHFGILAIAWVQVLFYLLVFVVVYRIFYRHINISLSSLLAPVRSAVIIAVTTLVPTMFLIFNFSSPTDTGISSMLLAAPLSGVSFFAGALIVRHPIAGEARLLIIKLSRKLSR